MLHKNMFRKCGLKKNNTAGRLFSYTRVHEDIFNDMKSYFARPKMIPKRHHLESRLSKKNFFFHINIFCISSQVNQCFHRFQIFFFSLTKGTIQFQCPWSVLSGDQTTVPKHSCSSFFSFIFHIKKLSHYQPVQLVTHYQKPALVFHLLENWIQVTGCHGNCISGHFLFQLFSHKKKKKFSSIRWKLMNACCCLLKSMQLNKKVIILFDQVFPSTPRNKGRSVHPKWEKYFD